MDVFAIERIINRARYVFATFFLVAALSSYRQGSGIAIWGSILAVTLVYYCVATINHFQIRKQRVSDTLIYVTVTIEILLVFVVKFSFHYDSFNGYGLSLKEPATFIVYFVFAVINGLRFNKRLNIYFGCMAIASYLLLLALGLIFGGMYFTNDSTKIFTPKALRSATEISRILFLGGTAYFLYLMAGFTMKNVKQLEDARVDANNNYHLINDMLQTVKEVSTDLVSSNRELSDSTNNIGSIIEENVDLIREITDIAQSFTRSIGEMRKKIDDQNTTIEQNYTKISEISNLMEEVHRESSSQSEKAKDALNLAENNEHRIRESIESIREMRDRSKRIEEISGTINDIADQTNLLSLNAAIESARAGEYGRGFAVVSDEISKLAGISSDSSKEISMIIRDTVNNIESVSQTVESMAEGLNRIIAFVKDDSSFIQNLNVKTEQEFKESKLLYSAIVEIDTTTKEVMTHFNNQTELNLRILEWMEKMKNMSEQVTSNLNKLMVLSIKLEERSVQMNGILEEAGA